MGAVADALADIAAAAATVPGVRVHALGESVTPPAVVIGPPELNWNRFCTGPNDATFTVYVIVALDDRALDRLLDLAPAVQSAIETDTPATVPRAIPGTYTSAGSGDLPAYELQVEYPL